jgi:hypothetical protein
VAINTECNAFARTRSTHISQYVGFSLHIAQAPEMMDFARSVCTATTFALTGVEPLDQFRLTIDEGRVRNGVEDAVPPDLLF